MFPYYGSKRRLAPKYPAPRYPLIIEPFAGAAGYSTHWATPSDRVLLYDTDPFVCRTWEWLLTEAHKVGPENLPSFLRGQYIPDVIHGTTPVGMVYWLGYCANIAPNRPRNTITGRGSDGFTANVKWLPRNPLPNWSVRQASAFDAFREHGATPATWFIDPPYQAQGHYYNSPPPLDYGELASAISSLYGQIIVCENGEPSWGGPWRPLAVIQGQSHQTQEVVWSFERIPP